MKYVLVLPDAANGYSYLDVTKEIADGLVAAGYTRESFDETPEPIVVIRPPKPERPDLGEEVRKALAAFLADAAEYEEGNNVILREFIIAAAEMIEE